MRRTVFMCFCFLFALFTVGCIDQQQKFSLDEEYYEASEIIELDLKTYNSMKMEILNLVLFGCIFYIALIGIPTLCEKKH